jgi:multicomponent Na+:H+ antiporter subunit D
MAQAHWAAVGVIVASTLLNAAYFLPIVYRAFLRAPSVADAHAVHGEAPWPIVAALVVTAAGTLALFFLPEIPLALARDVVGMRQ